MTIQTELRNADLQSLVGLLREQQDVKYDIVVPASRLRYQDGQLHVVGGALRFTDDGATECDAVLDPQPRFDDGVSDRLGIPRQYLRKLRDSGQSFTQYDADGDDPFRGSLLDANVNGWLQADPNRKFLVRAFRTDDPDSVGIARALLSDRYDLGLDNYDGLLAVLDGIRQADVDCEIVSASLTENAMRVRVAAPSVTALAPNWLGNYRSPFAGSGHGQRGLRDEGQGFVRDAGGNDLPVVFAGFEFRNSETGGGAFVIVPRITCRICDNGATVTKDAMREVHLGGRLDEGVVRWNADTQHKAIELVTAKARDAVQAFLSPEYVQGVVDGIEQTAGVPVVDAVATIERVAKVHAFTDTESASILDSFIKSGDLTAGGVMNAVTAAAQGVDNPDRQADLEDAALAVLATAASN